MIITKDMKMHEIILKLADGNPGALQILMDLYNKDVASATKDMLWFDSMEIYGSKLYMLWADCSKRDDKKFEKTIQYLKQGKISKEKIHKNLDKIVAEPFI